MNSAGMTQQINRRVNTLADKYILGHDKVSTGEAKLITTVNSLGAPTTMTTRVVPAVGANVVPLNSEHFPQVRIRTGAATYMIGCRYLSNEHVVVPF
jgi:hypothetical protein